MSQSALTGYVIASFSGLLVAMVCYAISFVRYYKSQHIVPSFSIVLYYGSDVFDMMLLGVVLFVLFGAVSLCQIFT